MVTSKPGHFPCSARRRVFQRQIFFGQPQAKAGICTRSHADCDLQRFLRSTGQQVQNNELLLVLDSMKMEIKITAQSARTIKSIVVAPGDAVKPGQILVYFE